MGKRQYYTLTRAVGLRKNQLFPYVCGPSSNSRSNPFRAKFRVHRGLPGYTGRDICLGNHEEEEIAALAVELFVAAYCLEYPEVMKPLSSLITSCEVNDIRDMVRKFPVIATDNELKLFDI